MQSVAALAPGAECEPAAHAPAHSVTASPIAFE
jgi:hypothetical protein